MKKTITFDVEVSDGELDSIVADLVAHYAHSLVLASILDGVGIDAYLDYALMNHPKEFETFYSETHEPHE